MKNLNLKLRTKTGYNYKFTERSTVEYNSRVLHNSTICTGKKNSLFLASRIFFLARSVNKNTVFL